jgi:hypothetical protein
MAPNKYRAVRVTIDGHEFASRAEGRRYLALKAMQSAGEISGLTLQPAFPIVIDGKPLRIRSSRGAGRQVRPVMDFRYVDSATGREVIEDKKGFDNPLSRLKRALVEHCFGITVTVVK